MKKKSFFTIKTVAQKKKQELIPTHLDSIVSDLLSKPSETTLIIPSQELPFGADLRGSSKAIKEGFYPGIPQPQLVRDISDEQTMRSLLSAHFSKVIYQTDAYSNAIGYSYEPVAQKSVFGKRNCVQYVELAKAIELFAYASHLSRIDVEEKYDSCRQVNDIGARVHVSLPSTSRKKGRYSLEYSNVPTSVVNGLKQSLSTHMEFKGKVPENTAHLISFKHPKRHFVSNQQIAGHLGIAQHYAQIGNLTPFTELPYVTLSPQLLDVYNSCKNGVLVHTGPKKYRHLRDAETSLLLGRTIQELGFDSFRQKSDPKIPEYPCFLERLT